MAAPPLVPAAEVIDFEHLALMTLGERDLERDVLALFDQQAAVLLDRMRGGTPKAAVTLAHTLNGSARGVGAWKVAQAAQAVECLPRESWPGAVDEAIGRLSAAVAEAHTAIAQRLKAS